MQAGVVAATEVGCCCSSAVLVHRQASSCMHTGSTASARHQAHNPLRAWSWASAGHASFCGVLCCWRHIQYSAFCLLSEWCGAVSFLCKAVQKWTHKQSSAAQHTLLPALATVKSCASAARAMLLSCPAWTAAAAAFVRANNLLGLAVCEWQRLHGVMVLFGSQQPCRDQSRCESWSLLPLAFVECGQSVAGSCCRQ
jgi:hypothetical protein